MDLPHFEKGLFVSGERAEPVRLALPQGQAVIGSTRCPGKDSPNEDAAAVIHVSDDAVVFVVADGMGGGPSGEKASSLAVQSLATALREIESGQEHLLRFAILNGIELANQAIQDLGVGAATTLAVVEVRGNVARPYHVGDSLILIIGQRGKLKLQTVPHSPVGYGIEAGLLDDMEAMHHTERHLVSNVVGAPEMRIEVGAPLHLAARDTLLLASDGLADNLHVEEIIGQIRKGNLLAGSRRLAAQAQQRMSGEDSGTPSKPDDCSLIAFRLSPKSRARPQPPQTLESRPQPRPLSVPAAESPAKEEPEIRHSP